MFADEIIECLNLQVNGKSKAIASFCTANRACIEAILLHYKCKNKPVLIEATSNQVNQYGGYTGMRPQDYKDMVYELAYRVGFDEKLIMLGGDHLGPLPWKGMNESEAMVNAKELVSEFVLAGYEKIHLDTSIKLASDTDNLTNKIIAKRGVELYKTAMDVWHKMLEKGQKTIKPKFIIGSEVPPAGGSQDGSPVRVTSATDLVDTLKAYQDAFIEEGIVDAFDSIVAVVVQPGVEFGGFTVRQYCRNEAKGLCEVLKKYPHLCFEGHSTDFQWRKNLREMAEDGVKILKVGPAITYAYREALFKLAWIENQIVSDKTKRSNFCEILDTVMCENPVNWERYYTGSTQETLMQRKYSFLDRCRYYLNNPKVSEAIVRLKKNIDYYGLNPGLIHLAFRNQYDRLYSKGEICNSESLINDYISMQIEDYDYAAMEHEISRIYK